MAIGSRPHRRAFIGGLGIGTDARLADRDRVGKSRVHPAPASLNWLLVGRAGIAAANRACAPFWPKKSDEIGSPQRSTILAGTCDCVLVVSGVSKSDSVSKSRRACVCVDCGCKGLAAAHAELAKPFGFAAIVARTSPRTSSPVVHGSEALAEPSPLREGSESDGSNRADDDPNDLGLSCAGGPSRGRASYHL